MPARSVTQNAKLHAMCRDIAKQMTWAGRQWTEKDWKAILLGGLFGQDFVPNPFGHSVVMVNNRRSSKLDEEKFGELLSEIEVFGIENGVKWTEDEDEPISE